MDKFSFSSWIKTLDAGNGCISEKKSLISSSSSGF